MIGSMNPWSSLRRTGRVVSLAASVLGFGTTLVIAQQGQQLPGSPPKSATAQGDISAWVKVCTTNEQTKNKQICLVKYEALDPKTGGVLVAAAVRTTEGEDKRDLLVNVPTAYSLVLRDGVRIKIDEDEPISLQYAVCLPTNCQAHAELTKQVLDSMRKGKQMLVAAINMQQKPMTFWVPLNGFAKTSDGAPVDAAKYQETRRRMMEFAKKAAEEQRAGGREGIPPQVVEPNAMTAPPKRLPAGSAP
jgi:invasion protein IalB